MKDLPVPLPTLMVNGVAEVPCGTCRLCCTAFFVFLDDDEYALGAVVRAASSPAAFFQTLLEIRARRFQCWRQTKDCAS